MTLQEARRDVFERVREYLPSATPKDRNGPN